MSTIHYRVTTAPSLDRLADSWKYAYSKDKLPVSITVERDHGGSDPHLVSFEMENCIVLVLQHVSAMPHVVRVELYTPRGRGIISHNATALIQYPSREGTLEFYTS